MTKGFRDFVLRGNVVDLAVAVVIGATFGAVMDSGREESSITPLIALSGGVTDFSALRTGPICGASFSMMSSRF